MSDRTAHYFQIEDKTTDSSLIYDASIGVVISFKVHGREVLYFTENLAPCRSVIDHGGIPILFPVCGSLRNDTYNMGNQSFYMPKHGFAFGVPWNAEVIHKNGEEKIIASLEADKNSLKLYPFIFEVMVVYTLKGTELFIELVFYNKDKNIMPFYAGLHPYFIVGDKKKLLFDINADKYGDDSSGELIEREYNGKIDFDNVVDFIFKLKDLETHRYSFLDPVKKREILIETSREFKHMVMWTENKDSCFLCLEPWMAGPDAMNTGEGVVHVKPGSSIKTWVKINVIDFHDERR